MLSALFPCFRSITPGQREAFSDQGLTRIPTACTNPGEGVPVAVLPVSNYCGAVGGGVSYGLSPARPDLLQNPDGVMGASLEIC